uniref:Uncharacterized protein n=1 Tax=Arundo donax TaxID=35708 RepID=A0A0A9FSC9_ARUDO
MWEHQCHCWYPVNMGTSISLLVKDYSAAAVNGLIEHSFGNHPSTPLLTVACLAEQQKSSVVHYRL